VVDDYGSDPVSHPTWAQFTASDGVHGAACVPVSGADGVNLLLYAGVRRPEAPGGVALGHLERVADAASVGLHHVAARARERELAALRERQKLAIDLHDSVAQLLFAIGVAAERSRQEHDPDVVATLLEEIHAMATAGRQELRETLGRLNHAPEGLAFEALLEAELRMFERQTGRHVLLTRRGAAREVSRPAETLLLDTLREGIRNAMKHGRGRVTVANLSYGQDVVTLSVQAELGPGAGGRGDVVTIVPGSGLGVLSERAERLHGGLEVAIDSDDVVILRLELPARAAIDVP
jgi:signal transduction histidine kinase